MTRRGGVSTGAVEGLNCGFGASDDPHSVAENRRRAADAVLSGARLIGLHQVHSPEVVIVDEPWSDEARPQADAMVSCRKGVLLGILTADCAPVLLADRDAGIVGAAHAGWKGALAGVIENTVSGMVALGADRARISAVVGPCIAQPSYEVDENFRNAFGPGAGRFFTAGREGRFQFDLPGFVAQVLADSGIASIEVLARDTYAEERAFYSFRRATHRGEPTYGRQMSLIGLA